MATMPFGSRKSNFPTQMPTYVRPEPDGFREILSSSSNEFDFYDWGGRNTIYRKILSSARISRCENTYKIIVILIQFLLFIVPIIANYTIYVEQYSHDSQWSERERRREVLCEAHNTAEHINHFMVISFRSEIVDNSYKVAVMRSLILCENPVSNKNEEGEKCFPGFKLRSEFGVIVRSLWLMEEVQRARFT